MVRMRRAKGSDNQIKGSFRSAFMNTGTGRNLRTESPIDMITIRHHCCNTDYRERCGESRERFVHALSCHRARLERDDYNVRPDGHMEGFSTAGRSLLFLAL